ncbi:MAG TPA: DedA family protein [Dehalococcoidia bacterium]|nr:DedA family protein [Dehalococcoidia bacterium]
MEEIEELLLDFVEYVYDAIGWPGVVVMMAVESACIPLPSEIIMPLAGWFLIEDRGRGEEWLLLAGFCGALGNLIGSLAAYAVGYWGGRPLLLRFGRYVLISREEIERAEHWFARYGDRAVFISRVLPVVRTFISLPAGVARMNVWRFSVLSFVGSFPWSLGLAWAGFLLGENWERIRDWMRPADIPILIVLGALVAWYVYRRVRTVFGQPGPTVSRSEE